MESRPQLVAEQTGRDIAEAKHYLRKLGDPVAAFRAVSDTVRREVESIREASGAGRQIIPELAYSDIVAGAVTDGDIAEIRHRGCVIIRGVFERSRASEWNDEMREYVERNRYLERSAEKAGLDQYFDAAKAHAPQIYGVFWSRPQVQVRQAESMAQTKRFLNGLYDTHAPAGPEFDPDHDFTYADRVRRRVPGDTTLGIVPHMDGGSYERWVDPAYQKIYAPIFEGRHEEYNPWKAAHRTQTREYASPAVCSMYRSFQGWTALTPQGPGDGTLSLIPFASSIAYLLLRALQPDVRDDELCGARPGRSLRATPEWHGDLLDGLVSIPLLEPGDTVWWQPDVVHAVANEHTGDHESNVIYVGASPKCKKNESYARRQAACFVDGRSAPDFAAEDYEVDFEGRATVADLTDLGRAQMAL